MKVSVYLFETLVKGLTARAGGSYVSFVYVNNLSGTDPEERVIGYDNVSEEELQEFLSPRRASDQNLIICLPNDKIDVLKRCLETTLKLRLRRAPRQQISNDIRAEIEGNATTPVSVSSIVLYHTYKMEVSMANAKDIMIQSPITIRSDVFSYLAWLKMEKHGIGHLPVVDRDDNFVGLIVWTDLLRFIAPDKPLEEVLGNKTVGDLMLKEPRTIEESDSVEEVARKFADPTPSGRYISLAPVIKQRKVTGVISYLEIFDNWQKFPHCSNSQEITAGEIGVKYADANRFPSSEQVFAVLYFLQNKPSRHIIVEDEGQVVALLDERQIERFRYVEGVPQQFLVAHREVTLRSVVEGADTLEKVKVASSLPVWNGENDSVVKTFLRGARGKPWRDRITGLLSFDENNKPVTLITPADCIRLLLD